PKLDLIASLVVAIFIGHIGWSFTWSALKELADTTIEPKQIKEMSETILNVEGVEGFHNLRARKVGPRSVADVNVQVSHLLSVSEGHEIVSWVAKKLIEDFDDIDDVTVHTDVENDMVNAFHSNKLERLPLRSEVTVELEKVWGRDSVFSSRLSMNLHYHNDKISIELFLPEKINSENLKQDLKSKAQAIDWFQDVTLWYS
ncbi:MAG: hypothetical protein HN509_18920, partial [Halobacteriovoraceae bacterium]|nr:hypothetical protein [Halobacteriovoraceae bacterium]